MSQQGGRPTGPVPEDDWWGQLYDDSTPDTGPTATADSLDDRFASASGLAGPDPSATPPPTAPGDRTGAARGQTGPVVRARAPWEPPPVVPTGPTTFPPPDPGPPPPHGTTTSTTGVAAPTEGSADGPPTGAAEDTRPPQDARLPAPSHPPAGAPQDTRPPVDAPADTPLLVAPPTPRVAHVGSGPPTYDPEPTALPQADPDGLGELVADTVLEGARCGSGTLRAASVRGDSARYRGEPRRDSLLVARFGTGEQALVLVAMATGARATAGAHRAAAEVCQWIARAVGRSHARLAEDIRSARRGDLKSGLHRLTDRSLGKLRAGAVEQGVAPEEYTATLRCLLLPADPACRTRVFFGVGAGGLFRLRDGVWQDIEPRVGEVTGEPVVGFGSPPAETSGATPAASRGEAPAASPAGAPAETPEGDRLTMDLGIPRPPSPYEPAPGPPREPFRFRASVARPGDTLLLCTGGLAEPLRGEPELAAHLGERWSGPQAPGLAAFLADAQVRVKGYADDRTAAAVWEA
ncbi:protein phosphatase 2C domain-containing protein [Streptomyces sp. enrichment culture]|uniref:protein phosphatase 2C domain-containing protein n=1 Tax=Streptomyces sp. enrichment culture TaxID=1795815 RepID=UPI003F55F2DD